jgi:DNA-binding transcriptional MocR family regulator
MNEPFTFSPPGRLIDFMRQADEPGLINLAAGVPGLESLPSESLQKALGRAFAEEGPAMFAYHHPEGDWKLRELLAARLRARGTTIQGKELFTVTGCQQGLQLLLNTLVKPGDIVACEVPAYYALLELIAVAGVRILPMPVRGPEGFDLDEIDVLLERWKPKCLFVCTTLSNPSGSTIPESRREAFVEICRKHGVRVIEDDIYAELTEGGAPKPLRAFDDGSTVSYVSSFSKSVSPGLRAGICVPGTIYEEVAVRKVQQDMHSSVVSEVALRCFLEDGALDPLLDRLRVRNRRRRSIAIETINRSFPEGTIVWPQPGGYMAWVELPGLFDLVKARGLAREHRVVFAAGTVFFPEPQGKSYLRLNCAKASETELVEGLEVLGRVMKEVAPR